MHVIWSLPGKIKVVEVERSTSSPREGQRAAWTEYQVRQGRRVLSRHDLRTQALAAAQAVLRA